MGVGSISMTWEASAGGSKGVGEDGGEGGGENEGGRGGGRGYNSFTTHQHVKDTRNETHAGGELRNSPKRESTARPMYELGREGARRHGR